MFSYDERKIRKNMTAKYLRLSSEDGDKEESNSISNQRELIEAYVASHPEINTVDEYVDDGYTGTNFDRPAFKRMLADAQKGKINCIIVKDLSRLGRDYIGMGRYMERIFPLMGIRFIAINDNYDSAKQEYPDDNTVVLFKNLLNDSYSRDISVKIRTNLDVKRRNGEYVGGYAPYGYKKDEKNRNCLVTDEEAAKVVYDIFQWKLDGMSTQGIADRLNEKGIMCPGEYKKSKGPDYTAAFYAAGSDAHNHAKWGAMQVLRILMNEVYLGTLVQGRRSKVNYKVKKLKDVDRSNWVRVENTHKPIISREVYDTVQEVLKLDTRTSPKGDVVNLFSGIVRCGGCKSNMVRRKVTKNGRQYVYLHCSSYHRKQGCTSHLISEKRLENIVFDIIKKDMQILDIIDENSEHLKMAQEKQPEYGQTFIDPDKLADINREIVHYNTLLVQLNNDMEAGIITKEEYVEFGKDFRNRITQAERERDILKNKQAKIMNMDISDMPWIKHFKKYRRCMRISRRMLVELVEEITVYDKSHISIRYRYDDEIKSIVKYCTCFGNISANEMTGIEMADIEMTGIDIMDDEMIEGAL